MEYFMTVVSTCLMFAMFPLGLFSLDIELAINNTQDVSTNVTCGSKVVFMCSLSTAPKFYVEWLLDGSSVSRCASTCTPTSGTPSHYTFTRNSDGTEYHLTIDPFTFNDSKPFVCQDDDMVKSNTIKTNVVARYSEDTLTVAIANNTNSVTVAATTNCLPSSMNVVYRLKYQKQGFINADYVDFPNSTPVVQYLECTNGETPYCGGNATKRGNTTLSIRTSNSGETYTFLLRVEDNGILLDQKQIGSFRIEGQATSVILMSDTDNFIRVTVIILIVAGAFVLGLMCVACAIHHKEKQDKEHKHTENNSTFSNDSQRSENNLQETNLRNEGTHTPIEKYGTDENDVLLVVSACVNTNMTSKMCTLFPGTSTV